MPSVPVAAGSGSDGDGARDLQVLTISVRVLGSLRRHVQGQHRLSLSVGEGTTVGEAIDSLGIPIEELSIVRLNGECAELTAPLKAGDHIDILTPAAGG
jgi:molybdopterin converting factor small subunit